MQDNRVQSYGKFEEKKMRIKNDIEDIVEKNQKARPIPPTESFRPYPGSDTIKWSRVQPVYKGELYIIKRCGR